jgi:fumarate hydratase class II
VVRWGEQTELARANSPIVGEPMPTSVIRALAMIKAEAALVNADLGAIDPAMASAIHTASNEIVAGAMFDQFPLDVFQTGSGTSTNMNVNEVVAHRASELLGRSVHPNDDVNRSQSSNDVVPSAIRIAAGMMLAADLTPALRRFQEELIAQGEQHASTVKLGRTHLMDAIPLTFGQEISGWARAVELSVDRLGTAWTRLRELPVGGTAVGTGLNAPASFGTEMAARLARRTGLDLVEARNHFEAQATQDATLEMSAACRSVAMSLNKIALDLRLLSAGPVGGPAEITLPALQAGSSIMPGKVNPVVPEIVQQIAAQVIGNDAAIVFAAGMLSALQLSTCVPVVARDLVSSIELLTRGVMLLDQRCVRAITADEPKMREMAGRSSALLTVLAPTIGYDAVARIVGAMREREQSIVEAAADAGIDVSRLDLLALSHPATAELVPPTSATGTGT